MQKIVNGQLVAMTQAEINERASRTQPVPLAVTPRQMRLALIQLGKMAQVNSYVATLSETAKVEWEYATVVERTSPLIAAASQGLSMTSADVDNLFRLAATL